MKPKAQVPLDMSGIYSNDQGHFRHLNILQRVVMGWVILPRTNVSETLPSRSHKIHPSLSFFLQSIILLSSSLSLCLEDLFGFSVWENQKPGKLRSKKTEAS